MRPSGGRQRLSNSRHRPQWSRGAQILCCVAALLLFVSQVSPARQQLLKRRRLGEDTALSAALDGLPVSPSAGSGMAGVNIYGLDHSLLAALQGNSSNSTGQPSNSSQGPTGAPAPQLAKASPSMPAQHIPSQLLNRGSSIVPAMAPQTTATPPRSNVTPLDPLLAAALENQGRVSAPAVATRAPYGSSAPAVAPASIPGPAASAAFSPQARARRSRQASAAPQHPPCHAIMPLPRSGTSGPLLSHHLLYAALVCNWVGTWQCNDGSQLKSAKLVQSKVVCDTPAWQAASLKLLHERPFASLFLESIDQTVFDPTGLEHINNIYYIVFNRRASLCLGPTFRRCAPRAHDVAGTQTESCHRMLKGFA